MNDDVDDHMGLETSKLNYNRFYISSAVRRPSQAPNLILDWNRFQLPNNSVLHTLNGLETLEAPANGLPDTTYPLLANEKNVPYLWLNTHLADKTSKPFGVDDNYTYRPAKLAAEISHFYQTHRKFHRILSPRTMGTMSGTLTWVDYSPLNMMRVNGVLHLYRKFDIILRTILNMITAIGKGPHHFILIPQNNEVYSRTLLQRSFKEFSTGTLNPFNHDPSIYFVLHALGYVYGRTHDLSVKPYKEDIRIYGKDDPVFGEIKSTSLFERLNPDLFDSINLIFQRGDRAVVYNMGDIAKFSDDPSFYIKFYRHIMNLRLTESILPAHIDPDSDQFDAFVNTVSATPEPTTSDTEVVPETTPDTTIPDVAVTEPIHVTKPYSVVSSNPLTPVTKSETHITPIHHSHDAFEKKLRVATDTHFAANSVDQTDPKRISKKENLFEGHLKATIHGKPIGELISDTTSSIIAPKTMDFVKSTPELSYQKSSLVAMDKFYQDHVYHRELGKVLSSTAKHGLFITKVDEDKINSEMDRTVTYNVSLSDLDGKSHKIKFTVPDVDKNGLMKLGGIEYRLTRQIANVPICKISPTRVNLSSYYNKVIIERIQSKRFSFENDIAKLLISLKDKGLIKAISGTAPLPTQKTPYDYTAIGNRFVELEFGNFIFYFHSNHAGYEHLSDPSKYDMPSLESKYGSFAGVTTDGGLLFWDMANQIHYVEDDKLIASWGSFSKLLVDTLGVEASPTKTSIEWTQAHILNQIIPIVFILAYQFGLKAILDKINLKYTFYESNIKPDLGIDDILIKLKDGCIVFNRYPLSRSLIASGLSWVSLKDFSFNELSVPQTYVKVLALKQMSIGVLKGLKGFIDFFVDPITETVLEKMHEPTTFYELLLRANLMLTDYRAIESSSVKLHRWRSYERLNGIVYNEIYRALANHRNNPTSKKSFSINPEAVFQAFVQDATVSMNDAINPVHEAKQRANFTFTGAGGRTTNSFVMKDRIYPKDGLGVISEAVPDSGKVGITAYLSASPNIDDIHGLPKPYKEGDKLEPPQILSTSAMLMPGVTADDGKRVSYTSIQLSHYVPNDVDGETLAVRTGYDAVLPHISSETFAIAAEDDGVITSVDEKQRVVKIRYAEKDIPILRNIKVPYIDSYIDNLKSKHESFGFLIPDTDIANYPIGGVFSATKHSNLKVMDRLRCENVDAIPDKDASRKQNNLIQDLIHKRYKSLYYIRFAVTETKTHGILKGYSFSDIYSPISGSYLLQRRQLNFKLGDSVKKGDIIVYNSGFFVPDPMSKQVTFKHGVLANVALIEKGSNHEDACEISRDLSDRLMMTPCHKREIITKREAAVLAIVKIGDHVETSDDLCVISDEYLIQSHGTLSLDNLDIMAKLSRQTPSAEYTGYIRKIRILYGCDRDKLSDSLKIILKAYEKEVRQEHHALSTDSENKIPDRPGYVKPGTRYEGIEFTEDTVILEFMIEETLNVAEGDKLVLSSSAKSIVSYVSEKSHETESGIPLDMLFSTTSIVNRIISSPLVVGIAERCMDKLKEDVLKIYFG